MFLDNAACQTVDFISEDSPIFQRFIILYYKYYLQKNDKRFSVENLEQKGMLKRYRKQILKRERSAMELPEIENNFADPDDDIIRKSTSPDKVE